MKLCWEEDKETQRPPPQVLEPRCKQRARDVRNYAILVKVWSCALQTIILGLLAWSTVVRTVTFLPER